MAPKKSALNLLPSRLCQPAGLESSLTNSKHAPGISLLLLLLLKFTRLSLSLALKKNVIVSNWTIGEQALRVNSATLNAYGRRRLLFTAQS